MTSNITIGAISVESYLQATGFRRRRRLSPLCTISLLLLTSAGSYRLGVWNGKHTSALSLSDAAGVLIDAKMPLNRRENALGHIYTIADAAVHGIAAQASSESPLSPSAHVYMRRLFADHFSTRR